MVVVELALGALLVAGRLQVAAGAAVAALFLAATAVLVRARLRGVDRIACGCFGGSRARDTRTLAARALGLALAGATTAVASAGPAMPSGRTIERVGLGVLAVAVAALFVLVLALYRQVGVLLLRIGPRGALELASEGPALGRPAPTLGDLTGEGVEVVLFRSAGCRLCAELAPGVRAATRGRGRLVTVTEHEQPTIFEGWAVPGTPYLVALHDGIVVAKGLANTLEQVEGLVEAGVRRLEVLRAA